RRSALPTMSTCSTRGRTTSKGTVVPSKATSVRWFAAGSACDRKLSPMTIHILTSTADGILLGLIYASAALGLSLVMGIMGVVNVAHSAFIMLGSYFAFELFRRLGIDPIVSLLLSLPVFFGLGALVYRAIITRVERSAQSQGLVAMFGLMVLIENLG